MIKGFRWKGKTTLGECWQITDSPAVRISKSFLEEGILLIMRSVFIKIIEIANPEGLMCRLLVDTLQLLFPLCNAGEQALQSIPDVGVQQKSLSADINVTEYPLHHFTTEPSNKVPPSYCRDQSYRSAPERKGCMEAEGISPCVIWSFFPCSPVQY